MNPVSVNNYRRAWSESRLIKKDGAIEKTAGYTWQQEGLFGGADMHSVFLSAQGKTALPLALVLLGWVGSADAQPISLVPNTVNMFRDTRGANDVGVASGDRFQFGADIVVGRPGSRWARPMAPPSRCRLSLAARSP